jgi:hypothetical protein
VVNHDLWEEFLHYGPTVNAYAAAADGREAELHGELEALVNEHNGRSVVAGVAGSSPVPPISFAFP